MLCILKHVKDRSSTLKGCNTMYVEDVEDGKRTYTHIFRWFKFTLKPPYSIVRGKLRLAIWDTSFWTFWLKFGHKTP